jgi:hypothetical protein
MRFLREPESGYAAASIAAFEEASSTVAHAPPSGFGAMKDMSAGKGGASLARGGECFCVRVCAGYEHPFCAQ